MEKMVLREQPYYLGRGLSTAPWVFSKVIREFVMYWRAKGINILPYLDDLLFIITGCEACRRLARIVEEDMRFVCLGIYCEMSDGTPLQEQIHVGFIIHLAEGLVKVPIRRWGALKA